MRRTVPVLLSLPIGALVASVITVSPSAGEDCIRRVDAGAPSVSPEADLQAALAEADALVTASTCSDWRVELTGTFPLTGTLDWTASAPLHLVGPVGATARIEAQGAAPGHRLLTVTTVAVVEVTLERLVLAGGDVDGNDVSVDLYANQAGAVLADDLRLIDVELIGNRADVGGAVATIDLTAIRTSFVSNRADVGSGQGGAVLAIGAVELSNVSFRENSARFGGAVHLDGSAGLPASLTARNVTFLASTSEVVGGGADLHLIGTPAQLPVTLRGVLLGAPITGASGSACTGTRFADTATAFTVASSLAAASGCGVPVDAGITTLSYDTAPFLTGTSDLRVPAGTWAGLDAFACDPADGWPTTDQRGLGRPQGATARCDVGAVERAYVAPAPPPPPPAPTADPVESTPVVTGPVPTSIPAGGGGCARGCP